MAERLEKGRFVWLQATNGSVTLSKAQLSMPLAGIDVAEQLEYVPATFRVSRHVRPKLACSCCDVILQAPAPSRPIERGIAGPGLRAHVLVAKFADHLPLYRQPGTERIVPMSLALHH